MDDKMSPCERASFRDGIPRVVERGLDLVHRDLVRIVAQAYRLSREVGADTLHPGQLTKSTIDRLHTVLTAHVGDREHRFLYLSHRSSFSSLEVWGETLDFPHLNADTHCLYTVARLAGGPCPPGARRTALVAVCACYGVVPGALRAPKRRSRSELLTTVTEESAIAAAAKMGALSRRKGIAGEAMAMGINTVL